MSILRELDECWSYMVQVRWKKHSKWEREYALASHHVFEYSNIIFPLDRAKAWNEDLPNIQREDVYLFHYSKLKQPPGQRVDE